MWILVRAMLIIGLAFGVLKGGRSVLMQSEQWIDNLRDIPDAVRDVCRTLDQDRRRANGSSASSSTRSRRDASGQPRQRSRNINDTTGAISRLLSLANSIWKSVFGIGGATDTGRAGVESVDVELDTQEHKSRVAESQNWQCARCRESIELVAFDVGQMRDGRWIAVCQRCVRGSRS